MSNESARQSTRACCPVACCLFGAGSWSMQVQSSGDGPNMQETARKRQAFQVCKFAQKTGRSASHQSQSVNLNVQCRRRPRPRCRLCRPSTAQVFVSLKMSINFDAFCDHATHGRLADVQQMLESGEVLFDGKEFIALVSAVENGHVDVVDCLLRNAMFDPSSHDNYAIGLASKNGHLAVVERLLQEVRVDPSARDNYAVRIAAACGHLGVLSNDCCKTSASTRRPTTTSLFDGLLRTVISWSSIDCCKTRALIRRPKTTTPCEWLLRMATSRSSIC
jgi:hypothetical protein